MVLGYLLYEGADIVVNLGKISYNTIRGIYYWYYDIDYPEMIKEKILEKEMIRLVERIDKLENYVNTGKKSITVD
jgi:hypothetical protein